MRITTTGKRQREQRTTGTTLTPITSTGITSITTTAPTTSTTATTAPRTSIRNTISRSTATVRMPTWARIIASPTAKPPDQPNFNQQNRSAEPATAELQSTESRPANSSEQQPESGRAPTTPRRNAAPTRLWQQPARGTKTRAFGNYSQGGNARTNSARGQQSLEGNRGSHPRRAGKPRPGRPAIAGAARGRRQAAPAEAGRNPDGMRDYRFFEAGGRSHAMDHSPCGSPVSRCNSPSGAGARSATARFCAFLFLSIRYRLPSRTVRRLLLLPARPFWLCTTQRSRMTARR